MTCVLLGPPHLDPPPAHGGGPCPDPQCHFRTRSMNDYRPSERRFVPKKREAPRRWTTKIRERTADGDFEFVPLEPQPQGRTRVHFCHAYGCSVDVPPALLMCSRHWGMMPLALQQAVWRHYRAGQEDGKAEVSDDYMIAAMAAIEAVRDKEQDRASRHEPEQAEMFDR